MRFCAGPQQLELGVDAKVMCTGGAEVYRNGELDNERRLYPGGYFDPLQLASDSSDRTQKLREAEIKHGRLAMIAFLVSTPPSSHTRNQSSS